MKKILVLILLFCSVLLNAATNIVSWNPPAGGFKKTYSDSYTFYANAGDILSCKCNGLISAGSSVNIYLTVNGERNTIYTHSTPHFSFNDVSTYQFKEDGEFTLSYSYTHSGGGTTYKISINATLNDFVKMTSLSLDTTSLLLDVGNNYRLNPIIVPEYASNKTIEWVSSDESIATISSGGVVTALKAGATTIYASSTDGTNYQTSCKVAVRNLSDHHDYIDLGLPSGTLWATTNIGASLPEEQGYNYFWGGLFPDFTNPNIIKYDTDSNLAELESEDDVATIMWGSNWKTPTKADFKELIDNCTFSFDYTIPDNETECGSLGYKVLKVTAKNGNYILLPQSARFATTTRIDIGYWSSSMEDSYLAYAYYFQTSTKYNNLYMFSKGESLPIRPVSKFIKVKELSIPPTLDLNVGENYKLEANIIPDNATDQTIIWSSNKESIAKIEEDGKITAIKSGTAEILAMTADGSDLTARCIVSIHNPVTAVTLDKKNISMHVNESMSLQATCTPIDADNTSITWSSSNNSIVTVNNGTITAKGVGSAIVTALSVNGKSATCNVIVETTYANSITINKTSLSLISGEQEILTASILPSYTTNNGIIWKSSSNKIATVSNSGLVRAVSTGKATITATTTDGTEISASCEVSVTTPVVSVKLNKTSETLKVGESFLLQTTCIPTNADNTIIQWSSSNNSVATVTNGNVLALEIGEATITATSVNGKEARCVIQVIETPVSSVTLDKTCLKIDVGNELTLNVTVLPVTATNKNVQWKSSNSKIVTVANGRIKAITPGEASITVSSTDGTNLSATCKVFVNDIPVSSITLDKENCDLLIGDKESLAVIVMPENATHKNIVWSSSNEAVATITNGIIEAIGAGTAIIKAATTDGTNITSSCCVNVNKHEQNILWNQSIPSIAYGSEILELTASSTSGLPITYKSSDENIISIFKIGNTYYLNSGDCGTAIITATQEGDSYYNSAIEQIKYIEVCKLVNDNNSSTLVLYSSTEEIIENIVFEFANNQNKENTTVIIKKISTGEESIDITSYNNILLVYPVHDGTIISSMNKYISDNKHVLETKNVGVIEYCGSGESAPSHVSFAKVIILNDSNIDDMDNIIESWLDNSDATGFLLIKQDQNRIPNGIFDLQGRKLQKAPQKGMYIKNGTKVYAK